LTPVLHPTIYGTKEVGVDLVDLVDLVFSLCRLCCLLSLASKPVVNASGTIINFEPPRRRYKLIMRSFLPAAAAGRRRAICFPTFLQHRARASHYTMKEGGFKSLLLQSFFFFPCPAAVKVSIGPHQLAG
jgi:hypothetical protein